MNLFCKQSGKCDGGWLQLFWQVYLPTLWSSGLGLNFPKEIYFRKGTWAGKHCYIYIIRIGTVSLESAIVHLPLMFHKNGQYIFRNSLIHFFLQELIYFYFRSWYFFLFQELVYFWFQELIYVLFQELIHFYFRSFGTPLLQLVPSARNCQGQFRQQIHIQNQVGKFCLVGGGEEGVSNCPIIYIWFHSTIHSAQTIKKHPLIHPSLLFHRYRVPVQHLHWFIIAENT